MFDESTILNHQKILFAGLKSLFYSTVQPSSNNWRSPTRSMPLRSGNLRHSWNSRQLKSSHANVTPETRLCLRYQSEKKLSYTGSSDWGSKPVLWTENIYRRAWHLFKVIISERRPQCSIFSLHLRLRFSVAWRLKRRKHFSVGEENFK